MKEKLRILHVTAPAQVGGLERVVAALAIGHHRGGHLVRVAMVVDPGDGEAHPLAVELRAAGVHVEPIEVQRGYLRERAAVAALCARVRPDVVHTHGSHPDVVDSGVARRLGIPVVSTVHGFTGGNWKNRFYEWLQERAYREFDGVIAVSQPIVKRLKGRGVPADRIHLLRNAWSGGSPMLSREEARRALGILPGEKRLGWIGRLTQGKGADLMISALMRLDQGVRLSVVGGGPVAEALRGEASIGGVADRVTWHGMIPDAGRLVAAFDVFVLSSRSEGTPIVLFEAMAAGVPVVTTAVGGVPDVVSDREAVLVPSEDAEALAAGVARVLADPVAARARAARARERLDREFAVGPWLEGYLTIYRGVAR